MSTFAFVLVVASLCYFLVLHLLVVRRARTTWGRPANNGKTHLAGTSAKKTGAPRGSASR